MKYKEGPYIRITDHQRTWEVDPQKSMMCVYHETS